MLIKYRIINTHIFNKYVWWICEYLIAKLAAREVNIEPVTHFERLWTPAASAILSFGNVPSASAEIGTKAQTEPIPNKKFDKIIVVGEICMFKLVQRTIDRPKFTKPKTMIALKSYIWQSLPINNTLKSINGKYSIANDRYALSKTETKLMQKKENLGIADRLNSLYQKEIELVTEQQVVSLKVNEIIAMISLYQALGGISFFNAENL